MRPGIKPTPLQDLFWPKVLKTETCWLWTATLSNKGYGKIGVCNPRRVASAHRVAWELTHGPIPDGLWVLHKCDVRACVNPSHLFLGMAKDNTDDMNRKGRHPWVRLDGLCRNGLHNLNLPGVNATCQSGKRRCRLCANAGQRRRWKKVT